MDTEFIATLFVGYIIISWVMFLFMAAVKLVEDEPKDGTYVISIPVFWPLYIIGYVIIALVKGFIYMMFWFFELILK